MTGMKILRPKAEVQEEKIEKTKKAVTTRAGQLWGMVAAGVNSTAVGIAVGFGILFILFTIGIVQFCCKYKCKKLKKCCKKKKKKKRLEFKDKVLTKVGVKKSPPPFSISGSIK